ncbi:hypothetical protein [Pseudomonas chlororaphis]|uniref:hypothetical protein n=1 Tax=Pseudomonas chlororaphis TaxID=587753 RepID=UPI00131A59D0|nr:hypothetical protein [Pseudomonas chlororaphis]
MNTPKKRVYSNLLKILITILVTESFSHESLAELINIPIKIWDVRIHVESGHIPDGFRILGPANKARSGQTIFYTVRPPNNFVPCYINISEAGLTGGGVRSGYSIRGLPDTGTFESYRVIVGAEAEGFPSWAGNTANVRVRMVAIQKHHASYLPTHPITDQPVLYPSSIDTTKITCPQNINSSGNSFGPNIIYKEGDPAFWQDSWIQLDSSRPAICPVGGFPMLGSPNYEECKPKPTP